MISIGEEAALRSLIDDYVSLSRGMRFAEKRTFWDADEVHPVLSPEESDRAWVGWEEIEAYWSATKESLSDLQSRSWGVLIQPISAEVVLVLFNLVWSAQVPGLSHGTPLSAHVRVTAAVRRKPEGWRFFSYVESHVDAVEYVRALYRSQALDELTVSGLL